jgi:hypothetical protein
MPWWDKYFFQIYWGCIAGIFALSAVSYTHKPKTKKPKFETIEYKDTIK